jgi:mutator protein MutT
MHKSVGAIIRNKKGEILMIDRAIPPLFWACPAGHIDEGETPEQALIREVFEEVGLKVENSKLSVHEFVEWNECSKGVRGHDWFLFEVLNWSGGLKTSEREVKECKWLAPDEISKRSLEKVWRYWFEKLNLKSPVEI